MNKIRAAITGVGGYVPDYILTNKELETMVETSDEWITTRTGIKERRILKGEDKGEDGGRYIDVSDPMPAVLAGLPALTTTARSEKPVDFHHVSNRRWQARKDGVLYQAGLKRLNGSSIGESIGSQLETAPAACRLDLDYGPRLD